MSKLNIGIFVWCRQVGRGKKLFKFCRKCVAMRQFIAVGGWPKNPRVCDICGTEEL